MGRVEPRSLRRSCNPGPLSPGIRTSRRMQPGYTFAWQAVQQLLGRSIGRDLVTGVFQTTFHRGPEGRIVVNNVHKSLHGPCPESCRVASQCNLGDVTVP